MKRRAFLTVQAAWPLAFSSPVFSQQAWPNKPIRFVVGFAPGGASDLLARMLGSELAKDLGTPVVIDNKPGMGGSMGADNVAKSPPDGYTILLGTPGMEVMNPMLYDRMPYDADKDFSPVTLIVRVPNLLVIHSSVPVQNVPDLIRYAKENPGKLNYASNGNGSASHLAVELLKMMAGIDLVHVPYKGSGPAMTDLVAGRVQIGMDSFTALYPQVQKGTLRALGVSTLKRIPWYPDIPAIAETIPNLEASSFIYVTAPARTPPEYIARLNASLHQALRKPDLMAKLKDLGMTEAPGTPQEMKEVIVSERAKWRPVVDANRATMKIQ